MIVTPAHLIALFVLSDGLIALGAFRPELVD